MLENQTTFSQHPAGQTALHPTRDIYFALMQSHPGDAARERAREYLMKKLEEVAAEPTDLPTDMSLLPDWVEAGSVATGKRYRDYIAARRAGSPRRYFASKAHALYFLKAVAPTKMVDGAWLYGLLPRWRDARYAHLIRIYLEELGEGSPDKNHVVIYRSLLATHGCDQWHDLDDNYFVQGTLQLALAYHAAHFLPEVIGFNLGYEQLPLHLLVSAYELNELGIDPYYFTLHVTVDNAASGHATKAMQGLFDALPHIADKDEFYRRVMNGYKLSSAGVGTEDVIEEFSLDDEVLNILMAKSRIGAQLHSDYCRIAGKTVNEWLSEPGQLPGFIDSLQQAGWIKRHQNPENSRFWKLIEGEQPPMFGVFNSYERQLIHDWIAGDSVDHLRSRQLSYRAKQGLLGKLQPRGAADGAYAAGQAAREASSYIDDSDEAPDDFDMELRLLEDGLSASPNSDEAMDLLIRLMSPVHHHTAPGLMATRLFTQLHKSA
ncbi:MAG TPA: iron-containing redox enzyme family protein [Burkholderiaceae bacterium]|nr:iron-containing redox enzyme family protein [Burkholderiaceae bacterium]